MTFYLPIACLLIIVVAAAALIYTLKVGQTVDNQKGEHDQDTTATAKHRILLNPVFLAYVIGFGGLLLFIFYLTMTNY
ncbi:hypothetical protein [Gracilibacillus alcaliphilus]|uniref:hypothetical protein n=1 Tax=Gracilibacillus alcaliphilus TaxID=1401441 RepID=UPI00195BC455|nr:hypothetical protein [Gracilibacillus alcaliphilus]MBM7678518.1 nitrate/nitrite transporter NarK [Gracilibacillus alcaliphilus]